MTNEEIIWKYLKSKSLTDAGTAGIMGNLYAESGLNPKNLQNSYELKLGYNDDSYTQAVDNGTYTNFVYDSAGFGLAQWTYWSRKQALLQHMSQNNRSIGDLQGQLDFLFIELTSGYQNLLNILKTTTSIQEASNAVLLQFERPADQSPSVQQKRASYSQNYYNKYAEKEVVYNMSNSSLVTYTKISPNKNSPRNHIIDTITIHCVVGQWTAKQGCDYFAQSNVGASANYIVGKDGSIGLCVDEGDRSWCSSNKANDNRAITIEVASDTTSPYTVTNAAYETLIKLIADICKRNNIKKLVWSTDKNDRINHLNGCNMTVHRDFANKSCLPITTEVLTREGWKTLVEIKEGEEIAIVSPEVNYPIIFGEVKEKLAPYKAPTITCQNFTATKDHRMLYITNTSPNKVKITTYEDLLKSLSTRNDLAFAGNYIQPEGLNISDDLLRLMVATQADGHYMLEYRADIPYAYGLEFHLKKERKIKRICDILNNLNYKYSINSKADGSKSIRIYNDNNNFRITDICETWLKNKEFTWNWLNLSNEQFLIFFEELFHWNGNQDAKIYCSKSKKNLNIISALCALHGIAGHIKDDNYCYREKNSYKINNYRNQTENIEELVSCVSVETGAFLCRQNGYTFIVGNCPGDYLYSRHGDIANRVNAILNGKEEEEMTQEQFNQMMNNWIAEQANLDPSSWSAEYRTWAEKNGLVSGDDKGRKMYKKYITREELVTVLYRALHRNIVD